MEKKWTNTTSWIDTQSYRKVRKGSDLRHKQKYFLKNKLWVNIQYVYPEMLQSRLLLKQTPMERSSIMLSANYWPVQNFN